MSAHVVYQLIHAFVKVQKRHGESQALASINAGPIEDWTPPITEISS